MSNPHYLKGATTTKPTPSKSETTGLTSATIDVSDIPVQKLELGTALIIGKGCHRRCLSWDLKKRRDDIMRAMWLVRGFLYC